MVGAEAGGISFYADRPFVCRDIRIPASSNFVPPRAGAYTTQSAPYNLPVSSFSDGIGAQSQRLAGAGRRRDRPSP